MRNVSLFHEIIAAHLNLQPITEEVIGSIASQDTIRVKKEKPYGISYFMGVQNNTMLTIVKPVSICRGRSFHVSAATVILIPRDSRRKPSIHLGVIKRASKKSIEKYKLPVCNEMDQLSNIGLPQEFNDNIREEICGMQKSDFYAKQCLPFATSKKTYILMPLMAGDLSHFITQSNLPKKLQSAFAVYALRQLIPQLQTLHRNNYAHRDIKPQNILVRDTNIVLSDLGLSCPLQNAPKNQYISTPGYVPPEGWPNSTIDIAGLDRADIYALGITMILIATGEKGTAFYRCLANLDNQGHRHWLSLYHACLAELSPDLCKLIQQMIHVNPRHRPDLDTCLNAACKINISTTEENQIKQHMREYSALKAKIVVRRMQIFLEKKMPSLTNRRSLRLAIKKAVENNAPCHA